MKVTLILQKIADFRSQFAAHSGFGACFARKFMATKLPAGHHEEE
jgi:hypothetical protein